MLEGGTYLRPGALKQKCGNSLQWKQIKHQPKKRNQAQKNFELEKFRWILRSSDEKERELTAKGAGFEKGYCSGDSAFSIIRQ